MPSQGLELKLRQEQKLSLQLVQTMEIITMSTEELNAKIRDTAEANPVLLVKERPQASYSALSDRFSKWNSRNENYSEDASGDDAPNWIEGMVARPESLQEHLLKQAGLIAMDEGTREAVVTLITGMDRNGFLPADPGKLLRKEQRNCLEDALRIICSLDPSGVGATSWRESLILQAEEKGVKGKELKTLKALIREKLELVREGKLERVARELGTDTGEIEALMDFIRTLTPFPGRNYSSDYENYIIPELTVKKDAEGNLRMSLSDEVLPELEIDSGYQELSENLRKDKSQEGKEARKFLKKKMAEAGSLISQIDIRTSTLGKLGHYLMDKQEEFFLKGPLFLKGLTMRETAEDIGVSEGTISRIASSKFIDTDFGVLPIRDMFSTKVESAGDENYSKSAVKEMIRRIIEENDSGKKLSDQKISDILAARGIKAARRTVAKYRSELDIDSSFGRAK